MLILGDIVIGPTNNYRRRHGIPMMSTKRYKHERKYLTKYVRVKYHRMKKIRCDDDLIYKVMSRIYGESIANVIVYGFKKRRKKNDARGRNGEFV